MINALVAVIPPAWRPLVPIDGAPLRASDLNDLYRRVINRNNRLKRLRETARARNHHPQRKKSACCRRPSTALSTTTPRPRHSPAPTSGR